MASSEFGPAGAVAAAAVVEMADGFGAHGHGPRRALLQTVFGKAFIPFVVAKEIEGMAFGPVKVKKRTWNGLIISLLLGLS